MKRLTIFFLLISSFAFSQSWTPIAGKQRFTNGLGIPVKDSATFATSADTALIFINKQDTSTLYWKYRGRIKSITGSGGSQSLQQVTAIGNSTDKGIRIINGTDTTISLNSDGSGYLGGSNQPNYFQNGLVYFGNGTTRLFQLTNDDGYVLLGDDSTLLSVDVSNGTIISKANNGYTFNGGDATFKGTVIGNKGKLDTTAMDGVVTPTMLASKLNISDTLTMLNNRINAITLNSSGVIHNSPINFVRSGGGWTGTMSLVSQSAYKLFGTGNTTSTPTFRSIDSNYFNGGFATQVRAAQTNTGGTVTSITAGTGLSGGTITTSGTITNNLITGLTGGQTIIGGTAQTDGISIRSTTNALYTNLTDTAINFRIAAGASAASILNNGLFTAGSFRGSSLNNFSGGTLSLGGFGTTRLQVSNTSVVATGGVSITPQTTTQTGLQVTGLTSQTANLFQVDPVSVSTGSYLNVSAAGITTLKKLNLTTGGNTSAGTATLSSGTITVSTTAVTASSIIMLTLQNCSNCGNPYISAKTAGTSFVISSTNVLDGSIVGYQIIN